MARALVALLVCAAVTACTAEPGPVIGQVFGTWGGADAGLIAANSTAHVHIGCTLGEADLPIAVNPDGSFEATGLYNVDAYPVDRGIVHPARFSGHILGGRMILTVTLLDTARTLGPVELTYGVTPQMGPCPICRARGGMPVPAFGPAPPR